MENKFILESLASDLKRVAMGKHRGSDRMADRFLQEALKRKSEVKMDEVPSYIEKLLNTLEDDIDAEDALMYSTLLQNYSQLVSAKPKLYNSR